MSAGWRARLVLGLIAALAAGLPPAVVHASDHHEAPGALADDAADIADVYAWHNRQMGTLTAVIDVAGLKDPAAGQAGVYDKDLLYTLHIDNTPDDANQDSDLKIYVRFGQNDSGGWGIKVENLPGSSGTVIGPVEQILTSGAKAKVFAGLRDDPFFFDLEGYEATLASDSLSFTLDDFFAGTNVTSIVLEMDLNAARAGENVVKIWATTARK